MATVKLTGSTYVVCPEGVHVFKVIEAKHDVNFQLIELKLKTPDGFTDNERYQLINSDGSPNDGATSAFSYFARCAFNNPDLSEIDPALLKGCFIKAKVSHTKTPSKKDPSRELTFVSLSDIAPATEEEWNAGVPKTKPIPSTGTTPKTVAGFDLDALFGRK